MKVAKSVVAGRARRRERNVHGRSVRTIPQAIMRSHDVKFFVAGMVTAAACLLLAAPARAAGANPNETIDTTMTAQVLAQSLVGPGVTIANVQFTGAADARGTFAFTDPNVVGTAQGVLLSSGNAHDVVGPNTQDSFSTDWTNPGDADLDTLSGFTTFDAAVLEFDFTPTANQVSFQYAFASDEYPEFVNTQYNDVFAFFINGQNCAQVRQVAGDPNAPFVPVAVNNINDSNPVQAPPPPPMRPDLYRANDFNPSGPSLIDLELDGITRQLTCQSAVNPGVTNHMKLAIADASDGVYDSAVFIAAGSLVSNENPTADLGLDPSHGAAPLDVTASVEGHDPNGLALAYTIDWGDGSSTPSQPLSDLTATATHTYAFGGEYIVTLTVSNGTLSGTDHDDVKVTGPSPSPTPQPTGTPESTATPSPTPIPTPTALPTAQPLDHFTCYTAGPSRGSAKFAPRSGVSLTDEFGSATVDVKKPRYLCAPTSKLGEDPSAPTHPQHLEGYPLGRPGKFPTHENVVVLDQLDPSGLHVDLRKPTLLLVPSRAVPGGPPPTASGLTIDHFQCYPASVTPHTAKFVARDGITLEDELGALTVDVQKPKLLCAPVNKNGEDPTAATHPSHLACYQVKQAGTKFTKSTGVAVANQFGAETLDVKQPSLLCVPAVLGP